MIAKLQSKNALACVIATILAAIVLQRIGHMGLAQHILFFIQQCLVGLYFLAIIIYVFIRKRRASAQVNTSTSMLAFWQGVTRYFLALDLCTFGIQKFFHLQFSVPLAVLDNPFSSLQPEDLMWAFFGHYFGLVVIIGSLEIMGGLMLLFRRTRLLAVILLMPLLLNILLLDYFFQLEIVVQLYITIEVLVLIYLISIEYDRLAEFFFKAKSNLPQFNFNHAVWKNTIRCSVIIIPLSLMAIYRFPQYYPDINGKYEVKNLVINNAVQSLNPCRDSILTKVFIDKSDFVLEFNNYERRFIGNLQYNEITKNITAVWRYPKNQHDTLFAKILPGNTPDAKVLTGRMGKEVFKMDLLRVNNK